MAKNRKNKGFTLVETMIAAGLSSVVLLSSFKLMENMNKTNSSTGLAFQANQIRKDIISILQNPTGWHNTMWGTTNNTTGANTDTFKCLTNYTDCSGQASNGPMVSSNTMANYYSASVTGAFDVYTPTSTMATTPSIYYQSTSATQGFTLNGAQCSTWSGAAFSGGASEHGTSATSSMCPLRLVLWWVPICPTTTGTCTSPTVHIMGYMLYTPSASDKEHSMSLNPGNYGINFVVNPVPLCPPQINAKCSMSSTNSTGNHTGTCTTSGACTFSCGANGSWTSVSNTCL